MFFFLEIMSPDISPFPWGGPLFPFFPTGIVDACCSGFLFAWPGGGGGGRGKVQERVKRGPNRIDVHKLAASCLGPPVVPFSPLFWGRVPYLK